MKLEKLFEKSVKDLNRRILSCRERNIPIIAEVEVKNSRTDVPMERYECDVEKQKEPFKIIRRGAKWTLEVHHRRGKLKYKFDELKDLMFIADRELTLKIKEDETVLSLSIALHAGEPVV